MKRHAIIDGDGIVRNMILWDGAAEWAPPQGMSVIEAEGVLCDMGWKWENGVFTAPPPEPPAQEPTSQS